MFPKPSARFAGLGALTLARLSHEFEDSEDDVQFLAVQDAVFALSEGEQEAFRRAYIDMHKNR